LTPFLMQPFKNLSRQMHLSTHTRKNSTIEVVVVLGS
jgi:hypothetical protein